MVAKRVRQTTCGGTFLVIGLDYQPRIETAEAWAGAFFICLCYSAEKIHCMMMRGIKFATERLAARGLEVCAAIAAKGRNAVIVITTKSGELGSGAVSAKSARALRLTKIRDSSLPPIIAQASAPGADRCHYAPVSSTTGNGTDRQANLHEQGSATIVSLLDFRAFVVFADASNLKASEVSLTCAQVIGAALALDLVAFDHPSTTRGGSFFASRLEALCQGPLAVGAFLILALTTAGSVLLGTSFLPRMDAQSPSDFNFCCSAFRSMLSASSTAARLICSFRRQQFNLSSGNARSC